MTDERTQINVRVDDAQHDRWKSFVTESDEYRHLSELIRHSVQKEIDGGGDGSDGSDGGEDRAVGELHDMVEQLGARFDSLEATVDSAAEDIRGQATVPDAVLSDVLDALNDSPAVAQTPSEIAAETDVSKKEASLALAQLRRDTGFVKFRKGPEEEEPAYWSAVGGDF